MATWEAKPEDQRQVLAEQNPWQRSGTVPSALAPPHERPLAQRLWRQITDDDPHRFQLILGPRRVGKTTVMYQTVRHLLDQGIEPRRLWWLRLDHPLLIRSDLGGLVRSAIETASPTTGEPVFLFLDELVYAEDWDLWLKTFHDDQWPVRVVATSSATAALRHRRLESGVGRWEEQLLLPYLLTEYLDLLGSTVELTAGSSLDETVDRIIEHPPDVRGVSERRHELLLTGGFPELLMLLSRPGVDDQTRTLISQRVLREDAVERAVYKDIPQSFGVDNPLALERLLYVLAGQTGGLVSPTRLARDLGNVSQPTLDKYIGYLERAFLVFVLPNYSGNEAVTQRRGRKLYFRDPAVRNAALQRGVAPLDDPAELGLLRENLAAAHLRAAGELTGARVFHWRRGNHEVDLVYDHPDAPMAFEIASSVDHSRTGLTAFQSRHGRFEGRCWMVAPNAQAIRPRDTSSGIGALSLDLFLLATGIEASAAAARRVGVT